jgi:hypothetical protein
MGIANDYPVPGCTWPASIEWFHDCLSVTNQSQAFVYLRPGSRVALGARSPSPSCVGGHAQQKVGERPDGVLQTTPVTAIHDTAPLNPLNHSAQQFLRPRRSTIDYRWIENNQFNLNWPIGEPGLVPTFCRPNAAQQGLISPAPQILAISYTCLAIPLFTNIRC